MKKITLLSLLLLSTFIHSQTSLKSFQHTSGTRKYFIHLPANYNTSTQYPLLLVLHGLTDSIQSHMPYTGFNGIADQENFIVVYPQALVGSSGTCWNAGAPLISPNADDVDFLTDLIDTITKNHSVNKARVYMTGFSMGGFMTQRMAKEVSNKIAAVATFASTQFFAFLNTNPTRPIPISMGHGLTDIVVNPAGNFVLAYTSLNNSWNDWKSSNSCIGSEIIDTLPDLANDGARVIRSRLLNCNAGVQMQMLKITNVGHEYLLKPAYDISYPWEAWNFVKNYTHPYAGMDDIEVNNLFDFYPNPSNDFIFIDKNSSVEAKSYSIYTIDGTKVTSTTTSPINVSNLPKGFYTLVVESSKGLTLKKLVVN
ncbi:MAG: T9SS type A sorting domain-containing protein [Bacteroidetes bacterium]|nr:T9SS type A sorting domain-containing protein [Bacteroidota bacterium]